MVAAPFDAGRRRYSGRPVPVIEGVVEELRGAKLGVGPGIAVQVEGTSQRARLLRLDRRGVSRIELPEGLDYSTPARSKGFRAAERCSQDEMVARRTAVYRLFEAVNVVGGAVAWTCYASRVY